MSTPVTQSCCLYTQCLLKPFRKNAFIFGFLQQEYMTASDSLLTSMNLNACGFNAYTQVRGFFTHGPQSEKDSHPLEKFQLATSLTSTTKTDSMNQLVRPH